MAERRSKTAVGLTYFAAVMMWVVGLFHVFYGFAAVYRDAFFDRASDYLYDLDVSTWGWIHVVAGIVVFLAGFALFNGSVWARTIGVLLAVVSAVANFLSIPYYPMWSITMIALAVLVIWALTVHGRDVET